MSVESALMPVPPADRLPPLFVGQHVRIRDFRHAGRYAPGPRLNRVRIEMIDQLVEVTSLAYQVWEYGYGRGEWLASLTLGPNIVWPVSWLVPVSSLAVIVQRYRALDSCSATPG